MSRDIIDTPIIDPNVESYEKFFDHSCCKRLFEAVETSPLANAVNALIVAWRSTNGAHILPWLMVESLKNFAQGEMDGNLRFREGYLDRVITGLADKLESRMQYSLKLDQRRALKRAVAGIEVEVQRATERARSEIRFESSGYWNYLVGNSEFQFCILGIQRINYGSLFFAYDDFLANVNRTREQAYSSKNDPIKAAFSKHFGATLADHCWNHDEVDLARLVRNTLAHNGGRFGKDLEKYGSRFVDATDTTAPLLRGDRFILVNSKIQIVPDNTAYLYALLMERVTRIVDSLA